LSESAVLKGTMLALSKIGARVFRNNVAVAAVGRIEWVKSHRTVTVHPGDAVVRSARVLHAGLCKGSADLIGWTPVVITPEMVGRTVAVFTAPETKVEGGREEPDQVNFGTQVRAAGGIAGFCYSPEEAVAMVREWSPR
jgi:hypothetical protein